MVCQSFSRKHLLFGSSLLLLVLLICVLPVSGSQDGFSDVEHNVYYADAVTWAAEKGITTGTSATTFSPGKTCTRGECVTFLYRVAGAPDAPDAPAKLTFVDVVAAKYYAPAVAWAVAKEITTGTSATKFSPDAPCSRGEIVTFLWRYAGCPKVDATADFTDVAPGKYYSEAVAWAVATGVTNGTSRTTFSPKQICTRGQIVTFLYRLAMSSTQKVDAIAYDMELSLDTAAECLTETVTMTVQNDTDEAVTELRLRDMTPALLEIAKEQGPSRNSDKKTAISAVTLSESDKALSYTLSKDDTVLKVTLDEADAIAPGEKARLTVKMKTDIPERRDRFGVVETDDGKLYALSFCFPYLADNVGGVWITDPYFDDGESRSYDLADYNVTFTAPAGYTVAATGSNVTAGEKTVINAENVRDFAIVACDFMGKDSFEVEGIHVDNYYLKGGESDIYRRVTELVTVDSLRLFTEKIGKYPYRELDIVPCLFGFAFGGMEYPGLVMTNATSFYDGAEIDAWSLTEVVAHEVAHQWFYATVGNREYSEGWLDEGFTTFLERDIYGLTPCPSNVFLREIDDLVPSIAAMRQDRDEYIAMGRELYADKFLNVSPALYSEYREYGEAEYDGGYLFLQEVRIKLGEDNFYRFLKEYYDKFYLKTATTKDVLDLLKKYDNSKEMKEILNFYFK